MNTLPTDEELADEVPKTRYWKRNFQFMRYWELPNFVREALKERGYDKRCNSLTEFECLVQRVAHTRRSRSAKRAAKTRRRNNVKQRQAVFDF